MVRVILGLLKGAVVGGGVGYGLYKLGFAGGLSAYLGCAVVGALVGVVCGRAPWKADTIWTPVVKMIVGAAIGLGLCALAFNLLPDPTFYVAQLSGELHLHSGPVLAPLVGVLYGIFVEVDDGGKPAAQAPGTKGKPPA